MIISKAVPAVIGVLLFCLLVSSVEARHEDDDTRRYSSTMSRAIDRLDDDVVEKFPIPVLFGVALSDIRSDFGDPRGGGTRLHEGQDIMAPRGTPIVSPTEAVVTRVGTGESAGKYVYTANPGGESWRYMHLDEIADIDEGDVLKPGDFIGTVGNTGNASGVAAHLHFEIRDGEALDPFPRLDEAYSLEEKMELVERLLGDVDDEDTMVAFLVATFLNDFTQAQARGYDLPPEITTALRERGVVDTSELQQRLNDIIASIPSVVTTNHTVGDTGVQISLLQLYLIFTQSGPATDQLKSSGATGYFGPITEAAVREYQINQDIEPTGAYDQLTRAQMRAG